MLEKGSQQLGIMLHDQQIQQFFLYKDLLVQWNEKMNLTAIVEEKEIILKHFLDSLAVASKWDFNTEIKMIDVGTGAGFPGIPLKIAYPKLQVTLLDSLNKRITFLQEVKKQLQLDNVTCIHGRAEEVGQNKSHREQYDLCASRAVAHLAVLAEYCLPFIKVGGIFSSLKGPDIEKEVEESKKAIEVLGGEIIDIHTVDIPYSNIRHSILCIKKIRQTPTQYPRKAGKPSREPITS